MLKTLALAGLVGIIIFVAWLAVQIVNVFPSAITSLANLANSVYSYDPRQLPEIDLSEAPKAGTTGENIKISWREAHPAGSYAFSYACHDGVTVNIKNSETDFKDLDCEKRYDLGKVDTLEIMVNSTKNLAVDLNYQISYFRPNSVDVAVEESGNITITNPRFALGTTTNEEEIVSEEEIPTTNTPTTEVAGSSTSSPVVVTTPVKPTYTYEYVYEIPVSKPNGFVDLKVTYLGVGTVDKNVFKNLGYITKGKAGAVQISVHNTGTKTSEAWYYKAELPGGSVYESPRQLPLKPNEKATLTLHFPAIAERDLQKIEFAVSTDVDVSKKNNQVTWSIIVLN
jgi:hypothetical protein